METGSFIKGKNEESKENPFKQNKAEDHQESSKDSRIIDRYEDPFENQIETNENHDPNINEQESNMNDTHNNHNHVDEKKNELLYSDINENQPNVSSTINIEKPVDINKEPPVINETYKNFIKNNKRHSQEFSNKKKKNNDIFKIPNSLQHLPDVQFHKAYTYVEPKKIYEKQIQKEAIFQENPANIKDLSKLNDNPKSQKPLNKNENIKSFYDFKKYKSFLDEVQTKNIVSLQNLPQTNDNNIKKEDFKLKFSQLKNDLEAISQKINYEEPNPNIENVENHTNHDGSENNHDIENMANHTNQDASEKNHDVSDIRINSLENLEATERFSEKFIESNQKFNKEKDMKNKQAPHSLVLPKFQEKITNTKYALRTLNTIVTDSMNLKTHASKFMKGFSLREDNLKSFNPANFELENKILEESKVNEESKIKVNDEFERNSHENEKLFIVHRLIESMLNLIDYDKIDDHSEIKLHNSTTDFEKKEIFIEENNRNIIEK